MELKFWWLGAAVLGISLLVAVVRWFAGGRPRTQRGETLLAANLDRVRSTARYKALVRRNLIWLVAQVLCLALAVAGGALLVSRYMSVSTTTQDQRGKDIVLCLDASSSASAVAEKAFIAYRSLLKGLTNERIALVIWNTTSLTIFPLTNDYEFVAQEMAIAEDAIVNRAFPYLTGVNHGADQWGSSLIGDGLATCVQRFDQLDKQRPRTIVLATDNETDGQSVYTLAEAVDLAVEREILVYGLAPVFYKTSPETPEVAEMRVELQRTGGEVLAVADEDSPQVILDAISRQEGTVFQSSPKRVENDIPLPGMILLTLGLVGLIGTGWRTRQ